MPGEVAVYATANPRGKAVRVEVEKQARYRLEMAGLIDRFAGGVGDRKITSTRGRGCPRGPIRPHAASGKGSERVL